MRCVLVWLDLKELEGTFSGIFPTGIHYTGSATCLVERLAQYLGNQQTRDNYGMKVIKATGTAKFIIVILGVFGTQEACGTDWAHLLINIHI